MTTGEKLDKVFAPAEHDSKEIDYDYDLDQDLSAKVNAEAATVELDLTYVPRIKQTITINDVEVDGPALIELLRMVTSPTPNRWYRFEKTGNVVTVHTKDEQSQATPQRFWEGTNVPYDQPRPDWHKKIYG